MKATTSTMMRVDMACLREQAWRAAKLFDEMHRYAKQIGCHVGEGVCHDEITCHTHEQERLMARWWTEHA